MARTRPGPPVAPDDPRHGTYKGYQAEYWSGGRAAVCPACQEAEKAYQNHRRRQRAYGRPFTVDATGTVRRLQALMAIGYSGEHLAQRLGIARGNLPANYNRRFVRADTARRVDALYRELIVRDGPSIHSRTRAEKAGWATPDQWLGRDIDDPKVTPAEHEPVSIDHVAVERASKGEDLPLTKEEKIELIRRAEKLGIPRGKTMKHLKLNGTNFGVLLREALETP